MKARQAGHNGPAPRTVGPKPSWSFEEDLYAVVARRRGHSLGHIAGHLGRPWGGVEARLQRLQNEGGVALAGDADSAAEAVAQARRAGSAPGPARLPEMPRHLPAGDSRLLYLCPTCRGFNRQHGTDDGCGCTPATPAIRRSPAP